MKRRPRIYYTESQKAILWERWRKGESLQRIAELFDRNHSSIQRIPLLKQEPVKAATDHLRSVRALAPVPPGNFS